MMETGWTGSIFCPHHFEHTGKVRETVKIKQLLCGVLAAAVLFVVSDSFLARDTFPVGHCKADVCLPFVVLWCYFSAQDLFALSILG